MNNSGHIARGARNKCILKPFVDKEGEFNFKKLNIIIFVRKEERENRKMKSQ